MSEQQQFSSLADAEAFLKSQGFWLVADSCDWTNIEGDGAGVHAIEGHYGAVKAWRAVVKINRRSDHHRRPDEAPLCASPEPDDELGMVWRNSLSKEERRRWMREAGDTGRAKDAWEAFKAAAPRDLDPKDVLADLFEEMLLDDPQQVAQTVIERLRDAGFVIRPTEINKEG